MDTPATNAVNHVRVVATDPYALAGIFTALLLSVGSAAAAGPLGASEISTTAMVAGGLDRDSTPQMNGPEPPLEPRTTGSISLAVVRNLRKTFRLAVQRVREVPSCSALFEGLGATGVDRLSTTFYTDPKSKLEEAVCRQGPMGFTAVGNPVTRLCLRFGKLNRRTAALALIHEALHYAGMPEKPGTPDAMSSREINRLVKRACDL